jgi:hypothetical protein
MLGTLLLYFINTKIKRMNPTELSGFLSFCIGNRFPALVSGRPGIGKTDIVTQAAAMAGTNLIIAHPVVSDPTDFKGLPFPKGDGTADFLPYGMLNKLIQATTKTVLFTDDLGQATPAVQASFMQLFLSRSINGKPISEEVTFIAATNRKEDKAGVTGILEPVKSRFVSIVELQVTVDDWIKWALHNDMPTELIAFIKFRPLMLDNFKATKDIVNSPSPRTVSNVGRMQARGLPEPMEFEAFKGAAGEAFAHEYRTFLTVMRKLPAIDHIILNPATADVPPEADLRYALTYALGRRATEQNIQAICTYLKRMPIEFATTCLKDASERNKELCNTKAFQLWSSENTGIFI